MKTPCITKIVSILTAIIMVTAGFYILPKSDVYADSTTKSGVVNVSSLYVRSGPGTGYSKYGSLTKGKSVTIKGTSTAKNGGKWYKIAYSSKTGYVYAKYITLKGGTTTSYSPDRKGFLKAAAAVRAKASTSASRYGTLSKGKIITLKGLYTTSGGTKWYKITYSSKTAYILASSTVQISYTAYSTAKTGKTTATVNVRSGPATSYSKLGSLASGKSIKLYAKIKYSGSYWYKTVYGSKTAYIAAQYVKITTTSTDDSTMTAKEFEAYMTAQGFPASYKPYLRSLHKAHPKWVFKAQKTGIAWSTMLSAEKDLGNNLVEPTAPDAWKTLRSGAYDFTNNRYVTFDGRWNQASNALIEYYLDPRNFLNDSSIYQFMDHKYNSKYQNTSTVKGITNSVSYCFMNTTTYRERLVKAGAKAGINPNVMTAMVIMEQGWRGGSGLISGTYSGYKGIYNHFNVGAYTANGMTATQRGLWWAKGAGTGATSYYRPWTSIYRSLAGGAKFYGVNYVFAKQNTYYLKKFNAMNGSSGLPKHEYSTAVFAADDEGKIAKRAYASNSNYPITFYIPVYNSMPTSACAKPGTSGNNDYYLKKLSVTGYSISPKFYYYTSTYKVTVPNSVKSVTINATAHNSASTVTGTGAVSLNVGSNNKYIKVKSSRGATKTYKIVITRKQ